MDLCVCVFCCLCLGVYFLGRLLGVGMSVAVCVSVNRD